MNEDEQTEETQEAVETAEVVETAPVRPSLDDMERELRAAGRFPDPPRQVQPQGAVEYIEGTNVPKHPEFDNWGLDKQTNYQVEYRVQQLQQESYEAGRNTRTILGKGQDWFKDELGQVLDELHPSQLGKPLDDNAINWLVTQAKGRAVDNGKSPTQAKTPASGAPVNTRTQAAPAQATGELAQLYKGLADAGYPEVANDPDMQKIFAGKN